MTTYAKATNSTGKKPLNQPHTIMEELLQEIQALQIRLARVGGGKIVITSQDFTIRLGAEHE